MVYENKLQLAQSLGRSQLLAQQSLWPMKKISPRLKAKNLYYHDWHKRWRDGGRRIHPLIKKLPVGIDVPEFLAELGMAKNATEMLKAVGDFAAILFYYLLRVVEYTVKNKNETKQTVQFKLEDAMFFVRIIKCICTNFQ